MRKHRFCPSGYTALLTTLFLASPLALSQPDFSGAWTTYRGNQGAGAFAAPAGEIKLKPEAQAARRDFESVTEGTDHGAGNSCVGYGMPASVKTTAC